MYNLTAVSDEVIKLGTTNNSGYFLAVQSSVNRKMDDDCSFLSEAHFVLQHQSETSKPKRNVN